MVDGGSPDIGGEFDKASPDVTQAPQEAKIANAPAYRNKPHYSLGTRAKLFATGVVTFALAACGIGETQTPKSPSATASPDTLGGMPTQTWTPEATATAKATATETQILISEVNIFDTNTWLKEMQDFWNINWLHSRNPERSNFQADIVAAREQFFKKEGIADTVAAMTNISEDLRSLWGMIYWEQTHKKEIMENHMYIYVTPWEMDKIRTDPAMVGTSAEGESLVTKKVTLKNGSVVELKYSYAKSGSPNFTSDVVGNIDGNEDPITIPYGPYSRRGIHTEGGIRGDFEAMGIVGGGETASKVLLIAVLDKKGMIHLTAPSFSLEKTTLSKGSACLANASNMPSVLVLDADLSLDPLVNDKNAPYSEDDLFALLGENILVEPDYSGNKVLFSYSPPRDYTPFDPILKNDRVTYLGKVNTAVTPDFLPLSKK